MRDTARRGLAVGFFDGVHLGHQAILRHASAALTFRAHPLSVLSPAKAPRLLMDVDERIAAIKACGVESIEVLDFTPQVAAMPAEEFIARHMGVARRDGVVYCGDNWRFGCGGRGDASLLKANGIAVEVVPYALYRGERISSTRIRASLEAGEMEDAAAMLGRPWSVAGAAFAGKGTGAGLGFPTVNLRLEGMALRLRRGVYAVESAGARAVANYGVAPTFGDRAWPSPVLEVHFIDGMPAAQVDGTWRVSFLGFLRPEKAFSSPAELQSQMRLDVERAKGLMALA